MLKRAPLFVNSGGVLEVDLPTYQLVSGTFLPVVAGAIDPHGVAVGKADAAVETHHVSVQVELPDNTPLTSTGQIDARRMRARYREHARFGSPAWIPPTLS